MKCPSCGYDGLAGMKYCGRCGTRLAHICPMCSFANPLDYRFCGMCGTQLTEGAVYEAVMAARPRERMNDLPAGAFLDSEEMPTQTANTERAKRLTDTPSNEAAQRDSLAAPAREPAAITPATPRPGEVATAPMAARSAPVPPVSRAFGENFALAGFQTKPLEGQRRIATVILADVRDSTHLLEQLGSEAWVEVMNHVFQILEAEIYRFGGEVNQFRGDGLVAFFGASMAHEDDPERAVLAALSMQEAIKPYASTLAESDGIDLKLRIGVNTGEVIVTTVGDSRQYKEDTAMGQAVAVAARMESAAEAGTVLVSDSTYQLVAPKFDWKSIGQIAVKGVSDPIAVYRPLDHQPDAASRPPAEPRGQLPAAMVSRAAQLETIEQCIASLLKGRGGICFVSGEKGMGKTFLVSRASQRLFDQGSLATECVVDGLASETTANDRDAARDAAKESAKEVAKEAAKPATDRGAASVVPALWLHGFCRSYTQDWPFSMWRDLIRRWLGAQDLPESRTGNHNGNHALGADALRPLLWQHAERVWGEHAGDHYPYLASLFSLPLEEPYATRARRMDAEMWQRQFFQTMRSLLAALAERQPVVVAFSDLQWADPSSIDLLRFCLPLCDSAPLLWLAIFRPDRTSPVWSFRHHVETEYPHRLTKVDLPPLTDAESGQLIDELIGPETLSPETRELVIRRAEGNPYFIKELIHSLTASGTLAPDEAGRLRETRRVSSLDLPDSLQGLLTARMDRLAPEQRRVVQMASVIGPVFWRNMLAALVGENGEAQLQATLTALQRAQLVQERGAVPVLGMEYAFTSSLVRDVAYDSLLATQRAAYHLEAAEYLEAGFWRADLDQRAGMIAYHYRHANKPNKELFYSLQAAEQSRKVYANAEAIQHYSRALELLDKMADGLAEDRMRAIRTERFEVLSGRRDVLYLVGDYQTARNDSRALLQLARELSDDPAWTVDALLSQPEVAEFETRADAQAGLAMAQEALALSQQLGDQRREVNSLMRLGNLYHELRDSRWLEIGERALELLRELGDLRTQAHLLLGLAFACGMDDLEHNEKYLQAAIPICHELDDKEINLRLLAALSARAERDGDYSRQLTECEQPRLQLAREMGDRNVEGHALMFCGQIRALYLGDLEGGLALTNEAIEAWKDVTGVLYPMLRKAQIEIALERLNEAEATLAHVQDITRRDFTELGRAGWTLVSAILCNRRGDVQSLGRVLELAAQVEAMVVAGTASRQYQMAAACESAAARLGLAQRLAADGGRNTDAIQTHHRQALAASSLALDIYRDFGFVQIIECFSEEILYRHSRALAANDKVEEADRYLTEAYDEMMRKHNLIPQGTGYRRGFIERIHLHQEIRAAYAERFLNSER